MRTNRFMARFMGAACFMSAPGENVSNATVSENEKEIGELMEKFGKKDKIVALSNDNQEAFAEVVGKIGEFKDWTEGADPKTFTGLALVRSENQSIRLIPIASKEAALNDAVVAAAFYKWYVNRVVNAGTEDDAQAAQFITIAGNFKTKFDLDAFKFQAKVLTKFLREKGLSGITNNSLRMSFSSAAFAKTQFPRVPDDAWDKLLGIAEAQAQKNNYDTSIFDHWKATRAVQSADLGEIELDFAELQKAEDVLSEENETPKS